MAMSASNTVSAENTPGHGTLRGRLSELLSSERLAVERTLDASHESQLIQLFRQIQNGGA